MKYQVDVSWQKRDAEEFTDNKYSRVHKWRFDGGAEISASSSPDVVPIPLSDETAVDPEEAFIASLSSCHMLWFLSIAAKHGFIVDEYNDEAEGLMGKNEEGKTAMTNVTLKPEITFSGSNIPDSDQITEIHEQAHEKCFIANSVKTKINIMPV